MRCCDCSEYSSCTWRDTLYFFATKSAVCSIGMYRLGSWRSAHSSVNSCMFMSFCTSEIDSTPAATITFAPSTITRCEAVEIACSPDAQ